MRGIVHSCGIASWRSWASTSLLSQSTVQVWRHGFCMASWHGRALLQNLFLRNLQARNLSEWRSSLCPNPAQHHYFQELPQRVENRNRRSSEPQRNGRARKMVVRLGNSMAGILKNFCVHEGIRWYNKMTTTSVYIGDDVIQEWGWGLEWGLVVWRFNPIQFLPMPSSFPVSTYWQALHFLACSIVLAFVCVGLFNNTVEVE